MTSRPSPWSICCRLLPVLRPLSRARDVSAPARTRHERPQRGTEFSLADAPAEVRATAPPRPKPLPEPTADPTAIKLSPQAASSPRGFLLARPTRADIGPSRNRHAVARIGKPSPWRTLAGAPANGGFQEVQLPR